MELCEECRDRFVRKDPAANSKVGSWLLVQIVRRNNIDGSRMLLFRQYKGIVIECYL